MKKLYLSLAAVVAFAMVSCGGNNEKPAMEETEVPMEEVVEEGTENQPDSVVVEEVAVEEVAVPATPAKSSTKKTSTTSKVVEDAAGKVKDVVEEKVVEPVKEAGEAAKEKAVSKLNKLGR